MHAIDKLSVRQPYTTASATSRVRQLRAPPLRRLPIFCLLSCSCFFFLRAAVQTHTLQSTAHAPKHNILSLAVLFSVLPFLNTPADTHLSLLADSHHKQTTTPRFNTPKSRTRDLVDGTVGAAHGTVDRAAWPRRPSARPHTAAQRSAKKQNERKKRGLNYGSC